MVGFIVNSSMEILIKDFSEERQQSYLFTRVNRSLFIVKYYSPIEGYCNFCGKIGCGCKKMSYKRIDNVSLSKMISDISSEPTVEIFYRLRNQKQYKKIS